MHREVGTKIAYSGRVLHPLTRNRCKNFVKDLVNIDLSDNHW